MTGNSTGTSVYGPYAFLFALPSAYEERRGDNAGAFGFVKRYDLRRFADAQGKQPRPPLLSQRHLGWIPFMPL